VAAQKNHTAELELDLRRYELRSGGKNIRLEKQPMELLILLVEKQGELASREDIVARLWGDGTFVDAERGINSAVRKIRLALHDNPDSPQFVQTVVGKGYRFISPVRVIARQSQAASEIPVAPVAPPIAPPITQERQRFALWLTPAVVIPLALGGWWLWHAKAAPHKSFQALAVLPFQSLSSDPSQEYVAEGVTEALITGLGQTSPLRIISHTSVRGYRETKRSIQEIARDLQVDAVIEGTVARSGDHLRVTANLIQVSPERHLWARSYDRDVRDTLALENELAGAIVTEVQGKLTPQQQQRLGRAHPINPDAELAVVKARYFLNNQRTKLGAAKAVEYAEQATQIDPNYGAAYATLAESYDSMIFLAAAQRSEVLSRAKAAAERALALDKQLGPAHAALAEIACNLEWDWARCEPEARRAVDLNPNDPDARSILAGYLASIGRIDEAIAEQKRARANDPLSIWMNRDVGRLLYFGGRYDEAIAELNRTAELDPKSHIIFAWIGLAYLEKGMGDQYIAMQMRQRSNDGAHGEEISELQHAYETAGLKGYWALGRTWALRRYRPDSGGEHNLAVFNAHLGDKDEAFRWLEEAYRQRSFWITWLKVDPQFASLRSDPRFAVLLRRMGLS
jgi:TolB-like protein/DNA-binding winged helix-turn-helix (wHTH) protein/tetratricopeptide (TPR) repeat protein